MINLKKIILDFLILSVFCTSLILAMHNQQNTSENIEESEELKTCKEKIEEEFGLPLTAPPLDFVKKAIRDFNLLKSLETMNDDVIDYYKSLPEKLSADDVLMPKDFCIDFILNDTEELNRFKSNLELKFNNFPSSEDMNSYFEFKFLDDDKRIKNCNDQLVVNDNDTPKGMLKMALFSHRQRSYNDPIKIGHTPNTYGYFYLEHIAKRVLETDRLESPEKFCFEKHSKKTGDPSTSST